MQLVNPDDGIVGPVASGFWNAIVEEMERQEHGDDAEPGKHLSLVTDSENAEAAAPTPDEAATEKTTPASKAAVKDPDVADTPTTARSHRLRRFLGANSRLVLLSVVTVGLAAALALTSLGLSNKSSAAAAQTSALSAAKTYAVQIGGYNYKTLDQDFGVVLADSTPAFQKSFTQSSNALKSTLVKYHATATASVVAAGLVSSAAGSASALVFLDQSVTNTLAKKATTDRTQVEINLVLENGKWMINNVTIL